MIDPRFIPACELLGDPRIDEFSICDGSEPPTLEYVQMMYRDSVSEEEDCFVLHRKDDDGNYCDVRMPKELMSYDNEMRNAFSFIRCSKLDLLFGFVDSTTDRKISSIVHHTGKYHVTYLPVRLKFPISGAECLTATITKPETGVILFTWIGGVNGTTLPQILEMLSALALPHRVITFTEKNVLCAIASDAKGADADAQAAWDAYWKDKHTSIAYHVMVGGYG